MKIPAGNPYNGIERTLNDSRVTVVNPTVLNPYNGIESYLDV
jgi:hypothetical protein